MSQERQIKPIFEFLTILQLRQSVRRRASDFRHRRHPGRRLHVDGGEVRSGHRSMDRGRSHDARKVQSWSGGGWRKNLRCWRFLLNFFPLLN